MPKSFIKKARAALPKNAPAAQIKLLEALSSQIHDEDLPYFDENIFLEMVMAHWDLARKKPGNKAGIKVYCPQPKEHAHRKTIVDVVSDDMAFLVDSVAAEINKNALLIELLLHPIYYCKYDSAGKLVDITNIPEKGYLRQSHIHVHVKQILSDEAQEVLQYGLQIALQDVQIANQDWRSMLVALKNARDELAHSKTDKSPAEIGQYCAFLDYLYDNNFTLLGYREYEFVESKSGLKSKTVKGRSLGLLSDDVTPAFISESEEGLPRNLQDLRRGLPPVSVSKTNRLSTVHRRVPMDAVAVKIYDKSGKVIGERLFLGLFTSVTYSRSVSDVPYLREKVESVMSLSDFIPGSHDRKALRHILEKYPRDELFQISEEELFKIGLEILRLQERQRIALFMRQDLFGRYISCLVFVPRERFGTKLRQEITRILERELSGVCSNFLTSMDDSVFARAMFTINISQKNPPSYNAGEIEKLLQEAGQTWQERLGMALDEALEDDQKIMALTLRYGVAFPVSYTSRYRPKQAVFDIERIEHSITEDKLCLDLYRPEDIGPNHLRLKVYNPSRPITLSDVMPILENMGLRAIAELPYEIRPDGVEQSVWIHDFLLEIPENGEPVPIDKVKDNFETAFTKIWYHEMDNDGLNKLVLYANLDWRQIVILRTYVRYLRQTGLAFSEQYIQTALSHNPAISRLIVELFFAMHDPKTKTKAVPERFVADIEAALEKVESLDQDRILRSIRGLVEATLRTNFYQRLPDGGIKPYLSIKMDCSRIPELPEPRPYREIFVYSARVEGVHLRGDKIARGGLRWSDRHEDYRTEILSLMKAQMVKNAVIVPMGAKGGFVVKTKTKTRQEFIAEGIECYKIFIRGLLDITDNLKGNKVVPPKDVVRLDGDDPYLVVAADKGTATFSDIANSLSLEYGFWMGDAFASGGSAGYDHKKMGITARGAWEGIKLHFRQLNHNTQEQPFDVMGVGDMGGDVFGNGMLLSDKIRLVGAFNHLHIFCDPDPDPASTFKERQRLFKAVQGWDQYDLKKLSKGGRIYSRSEKSLTLTPEIQKRFDIAKEKVSPAELMSAILRARTDLLWFGGIGTYIKSSHETHVDVGDKANDGIRVNASELRAKVIGEGANLGVTQRGRIEFSEKGGRINTDFLDNSGGVDSSDHEVNIKILLTDVMRKPAHKMDIKSRNILLEKMTDEVAHHVLWNNYQQTQAISLAELQAKDNLKLHEEFIQDLERDNGLNRELEGLPTREIFEARLRQGKGLTRPELCILLAYGKITFTQDLLASDIPDNSDMQYWMKDYFPKILQEKYGSEISDHRLRREIIAMSIANSLINRMGPTFIKSRMRKTGASSSEIAKAYIIVRDIYKLRALWDSIESLDNKVPAEVQLRAMRDIGKTAEHAITWFLTRLGRDIDIGKEAKTFGEGIRKLGQKIDSLITEDQSLAINQRVAENMRNGLPEEVAKAIAHLPVLSSACDIVRIATAQKADLEKAAKVYFKAGQHFHLDWLRQQARFMTSEDPWHADATSGLIDQLYDSQAGLTMAILKDIGGQKGKTFEKWLKDHEGRVRQIDRLFVDLRHAGTVDLPMLIIADQRLRGLYAG